MSITPADQSLKVGNNIKKLRTSQKRTLQEIADKCDLSKSMISKIENDKTVPSIAALAKIAKALGVSMSVLLEEDHAVRTVVTTRQKAEENLVLTEKGYAIYPYGAGYKNGAMQPFLFMAKKGEVIPHQLSHEGEEFIFILQGEMKMQVGEVEYLLKTGDSIYFDTLQKHGIMPVSDQVTYLDIFI